MFSSSSSDEEEKEEDEVGAQQQQQQQQQQEQQKVVPDGELDMSTPYDDDLGAFSASLRGGGHAYRGRFDVKSTAEASFACERTGGDFAYCVGLRDCFIPRSPGQETILRLRCTRLGEEELWVAFGAVDREEAMSVIEASFWGSKSAVSYRVTDGHMYERAGEVRPVLPVNELESVWVMRLCAREAENEEEIRQLRLEGATNRSITCYNCGEEGHMSRDCPAGGGDDNDDGDGDAMTVVDFFVEAEGIDEQPVMVAKAMGGFVLPVLGICGSNVEVVDYQLPGGGSKIKAARKR